MSRFNITTNYVYPNQLKLVTWCHQILTGRVILCNKLDIILPDSKECLAVDFSPPIDKNVGSDETKRILKYKHVVLEVQHM
jgi:hypothetical protein